MANAKTARPFDVRPLFAEPCFVMNIGDAITPKQVKFIQSLKMNTNQVNQISDGLYLFARPEMKSIAEAIQQALDTCTAEVMGIPQPFEVTPSWALMNPPGVGMHGHTHSNSMISGSLYYTDMPNPPGNMIFERFNSYRQIERGIDRLQHFRARNDRQFPGCERAEALAQDHASTRSRSTLP